MKSLSSIHIGFAILFVLMMNIHSISMGQSTIRIMPLGNSLTVGETGEPNPDLELPPEHMVGYRYGLKYLLQQGGYGVDFVGSQTNGSAFFNDCQHAGIGGSRDQYIERLLIDGYDMRNGVQILSPAQPYLDVYNPDIILLHIGTNDITHEATPITDQRVSAILDLVDQYELRSGKEVTVFLALIINRRLPCIAGSGCPTTKNWNIAIESMAQTRINNGDKIVIVDMEHDAGIVYTDEDFTASDPQGLHLNSNGYGKMAALWYTSIVNHFNTAPVISSIPDQSIDEDEAFDVIQLDNYVNDIEDPDADLTWNATHVSTTNLFVSIDQDRQASISLVDPNWSGEESIIFTVTDNGVNGSFQKTDSDTVTFSITPQNDPPVITAQSDLYALEEGSLDLSLSDFTVYDPDPGQYPEDQVLHILSGDHYTVSDHIVYPELDYDLDILVNVSVSDIIETGPVYQALVNIIPENDPPVYSGQSEIIFNEDESYTMSITSLDVDDVDHDDAELQIIMKSGNNHSIDGHVINPDPNFYGNLYIETHIEDPEGGKSEVFNLFVQIQPVNDIPQFITEPEDTAVVAQSYIYPFDAEDGDGEELEYTIVEKPDWLTYYPNSKILAGVPQSEHLGYTQIHIQVTDGMTDVDQKFYMHVILGTSALDLNSYKDIPIVFPNPSVGFFMVQYESQQGPGIFKLYDNLGRMVLNEPLFPGTNTSFSSSQLNIKPGIYVYHIQIGAELFSGKLIIQYP